MPLTNPYGRRLDSSETGCAKFVSDIDAADKHRIVTLRPVKGTMQLVVNQLIHNLCRELEQYELTNYTPHGDAILGILCEPRPIDPSVATRLAAVGAVVTRPTYAPADRPGNGSQPTSDAAIVTDHTTQRDGKRRSGRRKTPTASVEVTITRD
jgi:hypothetical protein